MGMYCVYDEQMEKLSSTDGKSKKYLSLING
jgi:hypothetical protein